MERRAGRPRARERGQDAEELPPAGVAARGGELRQGRPVDQGDVQRGQQQHVPGHRQAVDLARHRVEALVGDHGRGPRRGEPLRALDAEARGRHRPERHVGARGLAPAEVHVQHVARSELCPGAVEHGRDVVARHDASRDVDAEHARHVHEDSACHDAGTGERDERVAGGRHVARAVPPEVRGRVDVRHRGGAVDVELEAVVDRRPRAARLGPLREAVRRGSGRRRRDIGGERQLGRTLRESDHAAGDGRAQRPEHVGRRRGSVLRRQPCREGGELRLRHQDP